MSTASITSARELASRVGPLVGAVRRQDLDRYARGLTGALTLRYDEVKDWAAMNMVLEDPRVELSDGQEWFHIWLEDET